MDDDEELDEHCCGAHIGPDGACEICGALIPGTWGYYREYDGEPPEVSRDDV